MKINSNNSIIPPFLKEGDKVEIVASAKFISSIDIQNAIQFFKQHKLSVVFNKQIFNKKNVFAGTIHERVSNINAAFNNNKTKAILFARGGYGSIQLIDDINFKLLSKNPKWLIGFSDVTTILMHLYSQYRISCIHGPMAYNFKDIDQKTAGLLINLLKGQKINLQAKYSTANTAGIAHGKLIGGNLSIICSLIGSKSMTCLDEDYILFIEDVDEYRYHLERMLYMLDRTGLLKKIKGLIVGQMTGIKDNEKTFGKHPSQIIKDIIKKYEYPVCFNFPIGHTQTNHPVIIGLKIRLEVNDIFSSICYET
tara:strand:+ start:478 stop:1404 length:927 start_codon:yes stop_codon:yes gene_type:complete